MLTRRYSVCGEGVVVGEAVLVSLLQSLRQRGIPALRPPDPGALLRRFVPLLPVLPFFDLPGLPRQGTGLERYTDALAVGGEYANRVLREGHGVDDHWVFPRLGGVPERPVELLVAG